LSLAVFWLLFGTLKGPNEFLVFLVLRLGPKNLKINLGNPPKAFRKALYQLAVFGLTFEPETLETQSSSINVSSALESKNTSSQNIGAWDRMMTSYN